MAGGFADCLPAWAQILLQRNQPALTAAPAPAEPEPPPPPFDSICLKSSWFMSRRRDRRRCQSSKMRMGWYYNPPYCAWFFF